MTNTNQKNLEKRMKDLSIYMAAQIDGSNRTDYQKLYDLLKESYRRPGILEKELNDGTREFDSRIKVYSYGFIPKIKKIAENKRSYTLESEVSMFTYYKTLSSSAYYDRLDPWRGISSRDYSFGERYSIKTKIPKKLFKNKYSADFCEGCGDIIRCDNYKAKIKSLGKNDFKKYLKYIEQKDQAKSTYVGYGHDLGGEYDCRTAFRD